MFYDFNYYSLSLFVGGIVALGSGAFVFFTQSKKPIQSSWMILNISTAVWSFGYFLMITSSDFTMANYSDLILHYGAILIPVFYLRFILTLTNQKEKYKWATIASIVLAIFFSIITPTKLFLNDVVPKYIFKFAPDAGPAYLYFTIFFITFTSLAIIILFKHIVENTKGSDSTRLWFVLMSSLAGFIGGGSVFFLTFNINIPPAPIILFTFYPLIITYAILRHGLFATKVILSELIVFCIWSLFLFRLILEKNSEQLITNIFFLLTAIVLGVFLVKSVSQEVEAREEIERLVKDLTDANERLKEVDKMKTEFLSLATHQIRSPLTAIKGYASLILDGSFGKPPESIYGAVDKIFQSTQSLVLLVEDFLNISRIEQGRMKYEYSSRDLFELVQKVIGELKPTLDKTNLKYSINTDDQPHYFSRVDVGKMQQVFSNLIDNAIKYTPPPGSITISVYKNIKRHTIVVDVKDTGVGIDEETIGKLFKKFTRADDANKVNVIGTGLGLYIAKQMVEGMHGTLTVHSEGKGKGSTFSVEMTEDIQAVHAHDINNFADSL